MAQYSFVSISQSGHTRSGAVTPSASDTVAPADHAWLDYENTNASSRTITLVAPAGLDFGPSTMPDLTYTLAANTGRQRIPLPRQLADPTTGLITVNISATTDVTVIAYRV
jgi:hypothetical protein